MTEHGEKNVAVVNLVINFRVTQKFRKFLHQLEEKVIDRYDLSFIECISQFFR